MTTRESAQQVDSFDIVILGGGTGGYVAAIRAAQLGLRTAVVERDKLGGTCLHRGCIPTKALLESAEVLSLLRRSKEFGVEASGVSLDYTQALKRKDQVVGQLHQGVELLMRRNGITVVKGEGRAASPQRVIVSDGSAGRELTCSKLIVATGSRPRSLPGLAIDGDRVISSDHALDLLEVPKSIIIVGAGAVGVEFASLYRDMGSEVTLVELMPTLVPLEDKDVGVTLQRLFTRRGIKVMTGARVISESLKLNSDSVEVDVTVGEKREMVRGERLLVAVGREGILDALDGLKLQTERGYIKTDEYMGTGEPGVYAIGDVNGGLLLAHVAAAEGTLAVEHAAGQKVRPLDYNRVPRCTYCRPQIASIGLSEDDAKSQGHKVKIGRFPFQANGRALILGEADGFVKMVSDEESGEILGVHIIGPHATELIAESALARLLEATPLELALSIHAHPTLSEAVGEAAHDLEGRPIHIWRG
ncbi:MAG: dihydrolipoamide dehydrogenase [Dehalococcoidia bacterium]|nr:dihydrolipoamide dehydrogenase [Dehalococcoidia bacterium]